MTILERYQFAGHWYATVDLHGDDSDVRPLKFAEAIEPPTDAEVQAVVDGILAAQTTMNAESITYLMTEVFGNQI